MTGKHQNKYSEMLFFDIIPTKNDTFAENLFLSNGFYKYSINFANFQFCVFPEFSLNLQNIQ
jgi:hypothetical protein